MTEKLACLVQFCANPECPCREAYLEYVEEWDDERLLHQQFGSERFARLLEALDMASERPVVEFRVISKTHGLEYVAEQQDRMEKFS